MAALLFCTKPLITYTAYLCVYVSVYVRPVCTAISQIPSFCYLWTLMHLFASLLITQHLGETSLQTKQRNGGSATVLRPRARRWASTPSCHIWWKPRARRKAHVEIFAMASSSSRTGDQLYNDFSIEWGGKSVGFWILINRRVNNFLF